jgi:hypothetical protein
VDIAGITVQPNEQWMQQMARKQFQRYALLTIAEELTGWAIVDLPRAAADQSIADWGSGHHESISRSK